MGLTAATGKKSNAEAMCQEDQGGIFDFIRVLCPIERLRDAARQCKPALKAQGNLLVGPIPGEAFETEVEAILTFNAEGYKLKNRIIMHNAPERGYHSFLWYSLEKRPYFDLDSVRVPQRYPNKKAYKGKNKGKPSCNPRGKNPGDCWSLREFGLSLEAATERLSVALCPPHGLKMMVL